MGGLITFADAKDLPESASPRNWDVDFIIGSAITRPGLSSVFSFTTSYAITAVSFMYGAGTFTYTNTGISNPTVNETFVLSGFSGALYFLNGVTITAENVNTTTSTFQAVISGAPASGSYNNLSATATSTVGNFVGPNIGSVVNGQYWTNITAVLSSTEGYAQSSASGVPASSQEAPTLATNPSGILWSNPDNVFSTNLYATVSLPSTATSGVLLCSGCGFNIPANATVVGVEVEFSGYATQVNGSATVQLINNGEGTGTYQTQPLSASTPGVLLFGGSSYLWGGAYLPPSVVNGSGFGVVITVSNGAPLTSTVYANSLSLTISYTTPASNATALQVVTFSFNIPPTAGISGLSTTFQAYTDNAATVSIQFLKNGVAVGSSQTVSLTASSTVYPVGGNTDLWGTTWAYSDINNTQFGVQITPGGTGTVYINDLDVLVYVTPQLANFNYVKSYIQDDGQYLTLALDANGVLWQENLNTNPGNLEIALTGIISGSYAKSATADDREYIMFSDLSIGTDRPRTYDGTNFYPLSQVGPGAPPACAPSQGISGQTLTLSAFSISGDVVTFTYTGTEPTAGQLFAVTQCPAPYTYLNITGTVLASPAPTSSQFSMAISQPNASGSLSAGIATLTFNYPIISITQSPANPEGAFIGYQWTAGPGQVALGPVLTIYYSNIEDKTLVSAFNSGLYPVYVYIQGLQSQCPFTGTYQVTSVGFGVPAGHTTAFYYFTINVGTAGSVSSIGSSPSGTYQMTLATLITSTSIPNIAVGDSVQISTASPGSWDNEWPIVNSLNNGVMNITQTSMSASGVATYQYNVSSGAPPAAGQTVTVSNATNNQIFNTTGVIASASTTTLAVSCFTISNNVASFTYTGTPPVVGQLITISGIGAPYAYLNVTAQVLTLQTQTMCSGTAATFSISLTNADVTYTPISGTGTFGASAGTFTIAGFNSGAIAAAPETTAQAITYGTQFYIDPGAMTLGTQASPIYGNDSGAGYVVLIGGTTTPIGSGTRQAVVFFITESGFETAPSPTVTFTTSADANYINVSNVPIGPPNVIARAVAFTEAGQNGVPGANFYYIPNPVTNIVGNTTTVYSSTVINDNVSTSAKFTFTDAVLLSSVEIDIQGNNLFNLIELGSSAWCVPYAGRMFYGMQLNKVQNFNNLSFDGGYLPNINGPVAPSGWTLAPGSAAVVNLIDSPVTGNAFYVSNTTASTLPNAGLIYQSAYQDSFLVPIININTTYSVRAAASCPSGVQSGTLNIQLVDNNPGIGLGTVYGQFNVPLTSMTTNVAVFSGTLLTNKFITAVSPNLVLAVQVLNLGPGADCLIDRIEVFPTLAPYLLTQVYGSYIDDLEAIDASGQGGIIDTSRENSQTCYGGFVMHDRLYLLKTSSMYQTEDDPTSEPGGWDLKEVSPSVGACGINAYDTGDEWAVTACRNGIYGFNGGQPIKFMQELWNLWETINWKAAETIVLRNDLANQRMLCAIPLPVPNKWLPYEASNPNPTTPNVMLMLNYTGLATFEELMTQAQVHTTMFGTLASVDMKRKWSIWRIPTPYMAICNRSTNATDLAMLVCNGIGSSKIYQFLDDQLSDDGVAIWSLYTTYGFVNAAKAVTMPIFGMHAKRYSVFQTTVEGAGNLTITAYPNTLSAKYPYTIPGTIALTEDMQDDIFRPLNQRGNRMFLEYSTNAVGSWFQLHKILLSGKADPWSPISPTGGGNAGIVS